MNIERNKDLQSLSSYSLWKYLDLFKLFHLIETATLYFTRLDRFDDPLEGLTVDGLRNRYLLDALPDEDERNPNISSEYHNLSKEYFLQRKSDSDKIEKVTHRFASCWFLGKYESIAMWNLYSNKDSVAIQFDAQKLIEIIEQAARDFSENVWEKLVIGTVDYISIDDITKHRYLGFRKLKHYEYENELRFVAILNQGETKEYLELPLDKLNSYDFKIITHPAMEKWKVNILKKLLTKFQLENKFADSKIILRR